MVCWDGIFLCDPYTYVLGGPSVHSIAIVWCTSLVRNAVEDNRGYEFAKYVATMCCYGVSVVYEGS